LRFSDDARRRVRLALVRSPPIPQRIPPLEWRRPALVWTPLALALAIGWPAALFTNDPQLLRFVLAAGAMVFALALITLSACWALGRAPRTRRTVVLHVLAACAPVALAAPFVLTRLQAAIGDISGLNLPLALTPLALVLGLPVGLVSGMLFAFIALARQRSVGELLDDGVFTRHDVQPFR